MRCLFLNMADGGFGVQFPNHRLMKSRGKVAETEGFEPSVPG